MTELEAVLQQARAAVGAGRWHDGLELLSAYGAPAGAEALDLLGRAAYGAGRLELSINCREQLYRQPGLPPRFGRVPGWQVTAGEPVTVQRRNPAQRAGRG